jgi:hypothetical protein
VLLAPADAAAVVAARPGAPVMPGRRAARAAARSSTPTSGPRSEMRIVSLRNVAVRTGRGSWITNSPSPAMSVPPTLPENALYA